MEDSTDLTIIDDALIIVSPTEYDDDLENMGKVADSFYTSATFEDYHVECAENTRRTQRHILKVFSVYLAEAKVTRSVDALYNDASAWRGMTHGILRGFIQWQLQRSYAITTINISIATLHKYCELAKDAKVLTQAQYDLIMVVKGLNGKKAKNINEDRDKKKIKTRRDGAKKADATPITTGQALKLKKTTIKAKRIHDRDTFLEASDALLIGLIIEHAFRIGEIQKLDVTSFDRETGMVSVYREKTAKNKNDRETHKLKNHTRVALEKYLDLVKRSSGPLFLGYEGKRMSKRTLQYRVQQLGEQIGVKHLSPHDGRHFWTANALSEGTPLDRVQSGGGWANSAIVLRYAKRQGVANEGVKITEE